MNTNSEVERIVSHWLEDRVAQPPHGSLAAALERAERVPQQRHRLARWFGRGSETAGDGATARDDARRRIVPAASVAVAGAVALAIAAVLVVPHQTTEPFQRVIPGRTLSVAAEGADFRTVGAAVAAAQDGDTVLVEAGTYEEGIVIDKDITLRGNAVPPREVVIIMPEDGPGPVVPLTPFDRRAGAIRLPEQLPVGIQLIETDATVEDLVVIGQGDGIAMLVLGGAPSLEGLTLKHGGSFPPQTHLAGGLFVGGGSTANVRDAQVMYRVRVSDGSAPIVSESDFTSAQIIIQDGSTPVFTDNTFSGGCGCSDTAVVGGSSPTFRDNVFTAAGLVISDPDGEGTRALVEGNRFSSHQAEALSISDRATATVSGNAFYGNRHGIRVADATADVRDNEFVGNWNSVMVTRSDATIADNTMRGGDIGISIVLDGSPHIAGNLVENVGGRGIFAADGTSPRIEGNTICGSAVNLLIAPEAEAVIGANDVCPDGAEAPD